MSHDTLVFLAKTLGPLWMMAILVIATVLAYRPSRKAAYERAARSILNDPGRPEKRP